MTVISKATRRVMIVLIAFWMLLIAYSVRVYLCPQQVLSEREVCCQLVMDDLLSNRELSEIRNDAARTNNVKTLVVLLNDTNHVNDDIAWPPKISTTASGWRLVRESRFTKDEIGSSECVAIRVSIDKFDYLGGAPAFHLNGPVQLTVKQLNDVGEAASIGACFVSYRINRENGLLVPEMLGYLCH